MTTEKVQPIDLSGYCGSEKYYRTFLGLMAYTEGIESLVRQAECYWLLDLVECQLATNKRMSEQDFLVWDLRPYSCSDKGIAAGGIVSAWNDSPYNTAINGNEKPVWSFKLEFSDFPFERLSDPFQWYTQNRVMLLKSEH